MKRILYTIPLILSFLLLWFYLNYLQINKTNELYNYIPFQAEQVFQFNANHVFKKIIFERVFHEDAFLKRIPSSERPSIISGKTGIDFAHPLTIYKMFEDKGPVWVFMLKVNDKEALQKYIEKSEQIYPTAFNDEAFLVAIPYGPTYEEVKHKLEQIVSKEIDTYPFMDKLTANLGKDKKDVTFSISNHVKGNLLNIKNINGEVKFEEGHVSFESNIEMKSDFKMITTEKVFVLPQKGIHAHGFFEPKDVINAVIQDMPLIDRLPATKYFSLNITGFDFQMVSIVEQKFYLIPNIELLVKPHSLTEYENFIENLDRDSIINVDYDKQIIHINERLAIHFDQVGDMLYFSTEGLKKVQLKEEKVEEIVYLTMNIHELVQNIETEITLIPQQLKDLIHAFNYYEQLTFSIVEDPNEDQKFKGQGELTFNTASEHSIVELVATLQTVSNLKIVRDAMSAGQ